MGNIINNNLKDILVKSSVFNEFDKLSVDSISECSDCSYKYLCYSMAAELGHFMIAEIFMLRYFL